MLSELPKNTNFSSEKEPEVNSRLGKTRTAFTHYFLLG